MASSIPNLNSLRTGRRGTRLRGGRAGPSDSNHVSDSGEDAEAARDKVVQATDYDASSSRLSAVALGYLEDEYAREFLPPGEQIARRYPIINRGTHVRTTATDQLVKRFIGTEPGQRKQIVSLGAGSDTRFWRLFGSTDEAPSLVTYHELDFESNVNQKRAKIRHSPLFVEGTKKAEKAGSSYHLHALDLRDLTSNSPPVIPDMDSTLPTLLLSECCLCYLPPETATSVLQYFTMHITGGLALVLYEPIRPFDAFGKTMVTNLASRAIHMHTLKRYSSLEAQRQRLRLAGFADGQGARDVHQLYQDEDWVSEAERERVEKLEWLDEVEEWKLLASHYCVAWGWRGDVFGEAWKGLDGARTKDEDRDDELG